MIPMYESDSFLHSAPLQPLSPDNGLAFLPFTMCWRSSTAPEFFGASRLIEMSSAIPLPYRGRLVRVGELDPFKKVIIIFWWYPLVEVKTCPRLRWKLSGIQVEAMGIPSPERLSWKVTSKISEEIFFKRRKYSLLKKDVERSLPPHHRSEISHKGN